MHLLKVPSVDIFSRNWENAYLQRILVYFLHILFFFIIKKYAFLKFSVDFAISA